MGDRGFRQSKYDEPLVFDLGREGREGFSIPDFGELGAEEISDLVRRRNLGLPQLSELEVVRHFTRLSQMNWGIDTGPYPLGSCTMKYNPRLNEEIASLDQVQMVHPLQGDEELQGALELMYKLERALASLTGMHRFTLQPAAGAHGELTGCLIMRRYFKELGEERSEMIVPDTAHGTNPASAAMAGFTVVEVPTNQDGCIDMEALKGAVSSKRTAGIMMTNPNTLGIIEKDALEISRIVHEAGGLLYYDGANLQGILGRARPGDMGFDLVHLNLHKTFSTPHGGGGPGSGPVGVKEHLEGFLPIPLVSKEGDGKYGLIWDIPKSIGKVRGWYGAFPVLVRAYCYLLSMGGAGLRLASGIAVLNTNYFLSRIEGIRGFVVPFQGRLRKHEVVVSAQPLLEETGVTAMDVSKALLDRGLHPPTVYFPQIVREAMMFEFTETETRENIDKYIDALREISALAYSNPEALKRAPENTSVGRLDEVWANHPRTMALSRRMCLGKGDQGAA
ncbi:MAG: aminomethyl-transferring glycine dehydrogenase subunit GcvPB [Candidatus Methanosuratincola petrocarbonis]